MSAQPILIVVSGPSGSGKGTLCQMLRKALPDLVYSISLTTRHPRSNEKNGVDYIFVSRQDFQKHIEAGDFLEWAEVYGNYYGTLRSTVEENLLAGKDVLLELDIQGGQQVKRVFPDAVLIFIMPPSLDELSKRIIGRGTDDAKTINMRLSCAPDELLAAKKYDYVVNNDVIERAVQELLTIIRREKSIREQDKGV
ncbi:MAG: guanylate kinase [Thermacetogeniaceae bacterium]|nr:guanylate kinase [Thermoanaerobacterales bacterium]NLN21343.1 guanylate kinase [Syntrophomonadaceae bacterium]HAF18116.1 guanylate kinase [Peptococcaceae bacterium]